MVRSTEHSARAVRRIPLQTRRSATDVHLEPMPRLEWSLATEADPPAAEAAAPSSMRCSWIHRAPEDQVLTLFRQLNGSQRRLPAPWWLPALDRGELRSRAAAFELEDAVHAALGERRGWVFVPWANTGESGFWEYSPSERAAAMVPTSVILTDDHRGWINVVAAHADTPPLPLPVNGVTGLRSALEQIETW